MTSNRDPIFVNDGNTIVVIAKTGLCMNDPCDEYPYLSQAYRVVADRAGRVLALVPLSERPSRVSQKSVDEHEAWKEREGIAAKVQKARADRDVFRAAVESSTKFCEVCSFLPCCCPTGGQ